MCNLLSQTSLPKGKNTCLRLCLIFLVGCVLMILLPGCLYDGETSQPSLEQALEHLELLEFDRAVESFEQILAHTEEGSAEWERAAYGMAMALQYDRPVAESALLQAMSLLEAIVAAAGSEELRSQAALDIGRLHERRDFPGDTIDVIGARDWYEKAEALAPDADMVARIRLRLASSYVDELDRESVETAVRILQSYLSEYPDSDWATVFQQYMGDLFAFNLDNNRAALAAYERAYAKGFAVEPMTDRFLWRMISWAEEMGEHAKVIQYATDILDNHPRSTFQTYAREARNRARTHLNLPIDKATDEMAF